MNFKINKNTQLCQTEQHLHVAFLSPQRAMSSAILNGGLVTVDHIVNRKVPINTSTNEAPNTSLQHYADQQGWQGNVIGMMTAASMNSCRVEQCYIDGIDLTVLVTTGIGNARRAGDKADVQELLVNTERVGTINLILICSARMTDAAMLEAIMIATEAKAVAMQNAGVLSPISLKVATGTGTDAIAIVCGDGPKEISFCGKHVLFGELIGKLVISAITRSLDSSQSSMKLNTEIAAMVE